MFHRKFYRKLLNIITFINYIFYKKYYKFYKCYKLCFIESFIENF